MMREIFDRLGMPDWRIHLKVIMSIVMLLFVAVFTFTFPKVVLTMIGIMIAFVGYTILYAAFERHDDYGDR